jgi:hypothetical protein
VLSVLGDRLGEAQLTWREDGGVVDEPEVLLRHLSAPATRRR